VTCATVAVAALALTPVIAADNEATRRLQEASAVFSEVMATPDMGIPTDLFEMAHCIVIVPELMTAAFIVGG
jgi:lipid-binding SYLF domain-containing protein